MSKNMRHRSQDGQGVVLALAGLIAAVNGRPMALGTDGLIGIPETDTATNDLLATGRAASGLKVGETSVLLVGVGHTRDLGAIPGGVATYGKVYIAADGTLAAAAGAGLTFIGWKLPNGYVAIRNSS